MDEVLGPPGLYLSDVSEDQLKKRIPLYPNS
jgi:hypothetical protein